MRFLLIQFYLLRDSFVRIIILGGLAQFLFPLFYFFCFLSRHSLLRSFVGINVGLLFDSDNGILLSVNGFSSLESVALRLYELSHF